MLFQRPMDRRQALTSLSALLGAAGLGGCATQPPANAVPAPAQTRPVALRQGQIFRYDVTNIFSRVKIGQARYVVRSVADGGALQLDVELPASNTYAGDAPPRRGVSELLDSAHLKSEFHFQGELFFRDPEAWLPDDFAATTQQHRNAWRSGDDPRWRRWDTRLTVQGWERVRVPAGEFVALLVKREIWFDHPDTFRTQNLRIERLWHVPALGFWVKRELSGQYVVPSDRPEVVEEDRIRLELVA